MTQKKIAAEYCRKFPNAPSAVIARVAYKDHPEAFKDVEAARYAVRTARGSAGKYHRDNGHHEVEREENPLKFPEPDYIDYPIMHLDGSRFFLLPDLHAPYYDLTALNLATQEARKFKPDHLLINGDFLDMYRLSRFMKDPRRRTFADELKIGREILVVLRRTFPKAKITWKFGNHDERYETYMMDKAPELLGVRGMELQHLMNLKDIDVDVVGEKLILMMGRLPALHGHEWQAGISAPVNPARGAFLRAKTGVVVSHSHQASEHSEPNLYGELTTTWSTGCLCQLHPHYARINKWGHGFLLNEVDKAGNYLVQNKRIYKGRVW